MKKPTVQVNIMNVNDCYGKNGIEFYPDDRRTQNYFSNSHNKTFKDISYVLATSNQLQKPSDSKI